ncbi:LamG-like jellyroll fold domain-containing protein [Kitasatospora sp. NPDC004289]
MARAKASRQKVVIDGLTTEFSETSATPEGHLATTSHPDQQRVRRGASWVPLDATLARQADGSYAPKAAAGDVVLSGGGSGPAVTMTSPDGKKLALTAPFALPAPAPDADGDGLVYPNVVPDIDLKVTATKFGGVTTVFVVKTQAAAASPALQRLRFTTTTDGITITAAEDGALTASAADGKPRWIAPASKMWDSSTSTGSAKTGAAPKVLRAAPGASADGGAAAEAATVSSADGPAESATVATMPVTADASGLTLTPSQELLSKGTAPYFIDPEWKRWDANNQANAWTWVQSAYKTDASNWGSTSKNSGAGKCGTYPVGSNNCSPESVYRSFYQFNTNPLRGTVIHYARADFQQVRSANFDCNTKYPLDLYHVGAISSGTNWDSQPGQIDFLGRRDVGGSGNAGCNGVVPFSYDITGLIQQRGTTQDTVTLGLYGNEGDIYAFKRFNNQPALYVEYDRVPNPPTEPAVRPAPKTVSPSQDNLQSCGNGDASTWGWLGAGSDQNGAVALTARVSSPEQAQLYSWNHIWDYSLNGTPEVDSGYSGLVPSGQTASWTVKPGVIKDGHAYGYSIFATDRLEGVGWAGPTPTCFFKVDLTPPTVSFPNRVSDLNTQFPPSGNGETTKLTTGQNGFIPVNVADDNGGPNRSGVVCLRWSFDPQLSNEAWRCGDAMPRNQIPVTPTRWGTNILYIEARDNAGNRSPVAQYAFYVPWNPNGPAPTFGDVTGDTVPDILTHDQAGNLRAYTVPVNPLAVSASATVAAAKTISPDGDTWANYQTTHRGSLTGGTNIDALLVHKASSPDLWVYRNPGKDSVPGVFDISTKLAKPACTVSALNPDCSGYNTTWAGTRQIAALGDPATTALDTSTKKFQNRTGLLTVEPAPNGDAALWYYPTVSDTTLGAPIRLASTGWKDVDLLSPGDWAGQGHPGLWARNRLTGALNAHTFNLATATITDEYGEETSYPLITGVASTTQIATGLTPDNFPRIGSDGDLTGTGKPALWGITPRGQVQIRTGERTNAGTANPGYTFTSTQDSVLNTLANPSSWSLGAASTSNGTATDSTGPNPMNVPSGATWTTDHKGNTNGAAEFKNDGSMYSTKTTSTWTRTVLTKGMALRSGQRITAVTTTLTMQSDGNLVLAALNSPVPLWASGTWGHPGATAVMQPDGNFVIREPNGTPIWHTNTWNSANSTIELQPDRNLVLYNAAKQPIWHSGTFNPTFNTAIDVAANGPGVDTSGSYTLAAWAKIDSSTDNDQTVVCQNGDTRPPINLQYNNNSRSWGVFAPTQDDLSMDLPNTRSGDNSVSYGQWAHLAVTYDAESHALTLYVNGQFAGATTQPYPWGAGDTANAARALTVGGCYMNNKRDIINKLNGAVSDVRTYPYTLTPTQVTALAAG